MEPGRRNQWQSVAISGNQWQIAPPRNGVDGSSRQRASFLCAQAPRGRLAGTRRVHVGRASTRMRASARRQLSPMSRRGCSEQGLQLRPRATLRIDFPLEQTHQLRVQQSACDHADRR